MTTVVYSMTVSLDGFTAAPGDDIGWTAPDEQLHRFHNEQARRLGAHVCGRRLYETMLYWETVEEDSSSADVEVEFARIWKPLPKIVFSRTLDRVEGTARLARGDLTEELTALRERTIGDIGIGGATLASAAVGLGLVDEYRLFVAPVVLGAGTPFFPPIDGRIALELVETRTFGNGVVYLRYRRQ